MEPAAPGQLTTNRAAPTASATGALVECFRNAAHGLIRGESVSEIYSLGMRSTVVEIMNSEPIGMKHESRTRRSLEWFSESQQVRGSEGYYHWQSSSGRQPINTIPKDINQRTSAYGHQPSSNAHQPADITNVCMYISRRRRQYVSRVTSVESAKIRVSYGVITDPPRWLGALPPVGPPDSESFGCRAPPQDEPDLAGVGVGVLLQTPLPSRGTHG